eukprot:GHVN01074833.1.p1 GENE.GHVN01074833.1~~GHVN01074833.1.p1  ORF type:complete len:248 (+),score=16.74 GHVN01074833.1:79-822(+)
MRHLPVWLCFLALLSRSSEGSAKNSGEEFLSATASLPVANAPSPPTAALPWRTHQAPSEGEAALHFASTPTITPEWMNCTRPDGVEWEAAESIEIHFPLWANILVYFSNDGERQETNSPLKLIRSNDSTYATSYYLENYESGGDIHRVSLNGRDAHGSHSFYFHNGQKPIVVWENEWEKGYLTYIPNRYTSIDMFAYDHGVCSPAAWVPQRITDDDGVNGNKPIYVSWTFTGTESSGIWRIYVSSEE